MFVLQNASPCSYRSPDADFSLLPLVSQAGFLQNEGMDFLDAQQGIMIFKVGLAMVLAAVIGLDREMAGKAAGFRTHMLVAGASAAFVFLGSFLLQQYDLKSGEGAVEADPTRIIHAVVIGISFIGAGTIIRQGREKVEGLTTAASLLVSSAIGMCIALDRYVLGAGLALLTWLALRGGHWLEKRLLS